jgi:hypothetical protein
MGGFMGAVHPAAEFLQGGELSAVEQLGAFGVLWEEAGFPMPELYGRHVVSVNCARGIADDLVVLAPLLSWEEREQQL